MSREDIMARLNDVFIDLFDDEDIKINDSTTANDIDDWDSLEHINLIVAIEQEFDMKFNMNEVTSMKNVGEMVDIIASRVGN